MQIAIWMLAGAMAGWVAFKYFNLSEGRGLMLSLVVGAAGGILGGKALAPMLGMSAAVPGAFSTAALMIAVAVAAAVLFIGDKVYEKFGI
jgi:uncharacterized membrane protein YeaQ/YmgE (transglycosylase-associated protein family)